MAINIALTDKLLYIEAIDNFSDKVGNFVCACNDLGAHQFKFNYTARNTFDSDVLSLNQLN